MNILIGLIVIFISVFNITSPETMLRFQDLFRIKGERQYSDLAIAMTRIGGMIGIILGFILFFVPYN